MSTILGSARDVLGINRLGPLATDRRELGCALDRQPRPERLGACGRHLRRIGRAEDQHCVACRLVVLRERSCAETENET